MKTVNVSLKDRSYNVIIDSGIINHTGKHLEELGLGKKVFIISDDNVFPIYSEKLITSLEASDFIVKTFILKNGEHLKSYENITKLCEKILSFTPDRNSTIIALGGGVIGDLSGFTASILLRGINFIQIPTTLLSQVDSSVGGKTAINSSFGKNLIGTFYQPKLVLIDPDTLNSLPHREFLCGYSETLKYALINNKDFFNYLENNKAEIKAKKPELISEIIKTAVQTKANIVSQDETEKSDIRALLNLGHSFGHALEKELKYSDILKHGEAVAIGMILAAKFSANSGLCDPKIIADITQHLEYFGLPLKPQDIKKQWDSSNILNNMMSDKKNLNAKLNLILLRDIGKSFVAKNISPDNIVAFLKTVF